RLLEGKARDVFGSGRDVEARDGLRLAAIYESGRTVIVDALDDAPRQDGRSRPSPSAARDGMVSLVGGKLRLLAGEEHDGSDLLDRHAQLALEHHLIGEIPAVESHVVRVRVRSGHIVFAGSNIEGRAAERPLMAAKPEAAADIVLETGPADSRESAVAVPIYFHLAFAVPHSIVDDPDTDDTAEETAGPPQALGNHEVAPLDGRVLAAEGRVQVSGMIGKGGLECEIDLVVEHGRMR